VKRGRKNKYLPAYEKHHDSAGIYLISMPEVSKLIYVGSAAQTIRHRWRQHISDLLAKRHANRLLQRAVNKYGIDKLRFEIVELCAPEQVLSREQAWIEKHNWSDLFNLNPNSTSRLGSKLTEEDRLKLAERHGGISSLRLRRQIAAEYKAGATHGELARKYKVDRSSIRNYLIRLGVKMRPFASKNPKIVAELKRLYAQGHAAAYCASQLGIDEGTAITILRRSGDLRSVAKAAQHTANRRGRKDFARSAGAEIHLFRHPEHGTFRGYQFELRQKFGLNETLISQLCRGLRGQVSGWVLLSSPKESRARARGGKTYHFIHPEHGEFIGRQKDLMASFQGLEQGSVSALALGKVLSHKGWEIKDRAGAHVFRGGSTKTRSGNPRNYRRKIPLELHAQIKQLAAKGATKEALAAKYGVSASCIGKICRKGLPVSRRRNFSEEDIRRIHADLAAGLSQTAVGAKFGVHQASISNLCKRRGWRFK
jgi:group I intron endonuclease